MIDLRSDTITQPTDAMRAAMASAVVGDDVYSDDPTVNDLQDYAAERLGFEAAIFAASGTQTNLMAILSHCQRGDEYIVGHDAHTFKYEGGGAAVLGSVQPQTLPFSINGELDLGAVQSVIKPNDPHFANTRLLCLENTYHGKAVPMDYLQQAKKVAHNNGLAYHLDGARAYHAATYHNVDIREIVNPFDSVSICLSKGLSAPVGSLLLGSAELISRARKWRKMLGGGMRQAGILAAAGKLALTDMTDRLADDHQRANTLGERLSGIPGMTVRADWLQTNMVWLDFAEPCGEQLQNFAKTQGIVIRPGAAEARLVIHRHIDDEAVEKIVAMFAAFFRK